MCGTGVALPDGWNTEPPTQRWASGNLTTLVTVE